LSAGAAYTLHTIRIRTLVFETKLRRIEKTQNENRKECHDDSIFLSIQKTLLLIISSCCLLEDIRAAGNGAAVAGIVFVANLYCDTRDGGCHDCYHSSWQAASPWQNL